VPASDELVEAEGFGPPGWLRVVAFVPAAAVLSFGSVGLVLAINGWYSPGLAFPIGGVALVAVVAFARPVFAASTPATSRASPSDAPLGNSRPDGCRRAHLYALAGVVMIVAITAWNTGHASQHILIDRDGGSYANTGRWIARDGSLTVEADSDPFDHEPSVTLESPAVYEMSDGSLQFQFAHLLPVVLAEGYAIGGDAGLFHVPELLSGFALLAFFVLAWRLFRRPLFALSAVLALALTIPQVSFSRDSYSEIPSQILLFTALWLLTTPRVLPRWRVALIAGLFLGALEATRIDAVVFLIGVPVVCAVALLRSDTPDRRRSTRISIGAFAVGLVPGLALGFVDLTRHSGDYYSSLSSDVRELGLLVVASLAVCATAVGLWRFVFPALQRLPWNPISSGAAWIVAVTGFAAWILRPRFQHVHGDARAIVFLQKAEHVPVDATRLYFERSMSWMAWYLGPIALAAAIVAVALLVRAVLRGHLLRTVGVLTALLPGTLLYLYRANAVPDHIWVTRRFLVSAIPLLVLLALGLAAYMWGAQSTSGWGRAARAGAVAIAVASVAYPLYTVVPVQAMAEDTGYLGLVKGVCGEIGPRAAVVVLEPAGGDQLDWLPQPLRGWCGADVGITRGVADADALHRLAREWSASGRSLFVVASSAGDVRKAVADARVSPALEASDTKVLAQTLTHRPAAYRSLSYTVVVGEVPAR
jgi:hypothetical protein